MMAVRRGASTLRRELVADLDDARSRACRCARTRRRASACRRTANFALDVAELARVAHLAAGLRVERRAVEHDLAFVAGVQRICTASPPEQRDHLADVGDAFVAEEARLAFDA